MHTQYIVIGHLSEPYGIHGWLHLLSNAVPPDNIFNYKTWQIEQNNQRITLALEAHKPHGNHFVVKLKNCNDRDYALQFRNKNIFIPRTDLPLLKNNEYYWADLIGLHVENTNGESFGIIDYLFETGANDVIVTNKMENNTTFTKQYYIPYLSNVIQLVDLEKKIMIVDWECDK